MIAVSEGAVMADRLGIDGKTLMEILSVSTAGCWANNVSNPKPGNIDGAPASRAYEGGFSVGLMRKDLALALECAEQVKADTPFCQKSVDIYSKLEKKGLGGKDFGVVYKYLDKNGKI